jgi:hypothetical protein
VRTQPRRNSIVRERTLRVSFWNETSTFFLFFFLSGCCFSCSLLSFSTAAVQRCVRAIALPSFFCSISSRLLLLLLPLCVSYPLFAFGRVSGKRLLFLTDLFASPLSLLGPKRSDDLARMKIAMRHACDGPRRLRQKDGATSMTMMKWRLRCLCMEDILRMGKKGTRKLMMLACFWGFMDRFRQHCASVVVVGNVLARHGKINVFVPTVVSISLRSIRMLSLRKCMYVCVLRLDGRLGGGLLLSRDNMATTRQTRPGAQQNRKCNSFQFKPRYGYLIIPLIRPKASPKPSNSPPQILRSPHPQQPPAPPPPTHRTSSRSPDWHSAAQL